MQAAAAWCRIEWVYFKPFGLVPCVGGMFTFQARLVSIGDLLIYEDDVLATANHTASWYCSGISRLSDSLNVSVSIMPWIAAP